MIEDFCAYSKNIRGLSPATVTAYRKDLTRYYSFLESVGISLELVSSHEIRGFILELSQEGMSVNSINRILSALKTFYAYLVVHQGWEKNPVSGIRSLKKRESLPSFLFKKEIDQLLAATDNDFWGLRDTLILELLYSSGCRISEIVALDVSSIRIEGGSALIHGKGNKERYVFFGTPALKTLRRYLDSRGEHVADEEPGKKRPLIVNRRGGRITARGISYLLAGYVKKTGIIKHVSPHTFRHTFATHLLNMGADIRVVQELLGHSSLSTTQVYTHLGVTKLKKVYDRAHPHAHTKTGYTL